jgi:hypothetical protein
MPSYLGVEVLGLERKNNEERTRTDKKWQVF